MKENEIENIRNRDFSNWNRIDEENSDVPILTKSDIVPTRCSIASSHTPFHEMSNFVIYIYI